MLKASFVNRSAGLLGCWRNCCSTSVHSKRTNLLQLCEAVKRTRPDTFVRALFETLVSEVQEPPYPAVFFFSIFQQVQEQGYYFTKTTIFRTLAFFSTAVVRMRRPILFSLHRVSHTACKR